MPEKEYFNQVIFDAQFIMATLSRTNEHKETNPVFFSHTLSDTSHTHTLLHAPASPAPSSHVAGWYNNTCACAVHVVVATAIRGCSIAAARFLLLILARLLHPNSETCVK